MVNQIDVHAHLHDKAFDGERNEILQEMKRAQIRAITVGTDLRESRKALELANAHENLFATVGLHPADNVLEVFEEKPFEELGKHEKVVAIGECGLDYHYIEHFFERDKEEKGVTWNMDRERDRQQEVFSSQIDLALKLDKPLMLHGRPGRGSMDAYEDMLFMLEGVYKASGEKLRGNAHFFVGSVEIAKRFLDIGFTVSFPGVVTFAHEYHEVVRFVPLSMMHAETDSPYAAPAPYRGNRNSSLYLYRIIETLAELHNETVESVCSQFAQNAKRVFGI